jgi:hypothetical protein
VQTGEIRAHGSSKEIIPAAKLDLKTIAAIEFRRKTIAITKVEFIAVLRWNWTRRGNQFMFRCFQSNDVSAGHFL